eukprot:8803958-Pyramimonas_sp.AAC.1
MSSSPTSSKQSQFVFKTILHKKFGLDANYWLQHVLRSCWGRARRWTGTTASSPCPRSKPPTLRHLLSR